ncbi:hypothetical protein TorRG33x02_336080 [Trema orientale]|uniref:Uncharacterized protein n=1 Tax=Trema orientale TaxID=63057 RepID=A0A2P5B0M0_TREOI|nr:hypothetical protein TorRG33x02_336080 [Trema orientale]
MVFNGRVAQAGGIGQLAHNLLVLLKAISRDFQEVACFCEARNNKRVKPSNSSMLKYGPKVEFCHFKLHNAPLNDFGSTTTLVFEPINLAKAAFSRIVLAELTIWRLNMIKTLGKQPCFIAPSTLVDKDSFNIYSEHNSLLLVASACRGRGCLTKDLP